MSWRIPFLRKGIIERYYKEVGINDILDLTGKKEEISHLLLMRHLIVHRAGHINEYFCDRMRLPKSVWRGKSIEELLRTNDDMVSSKIEVVEEFVAKLDSIFGKRP